MSANIDVSNTLDEFEKLLENGQDLGELHGTLEILVRWSRDPDLSDASRRRAITLLKTHAPHVRVFMNRRLFGT